MTQSKKLKNQSQPQKVMSAPKLTAAAAAKQKKHRDMFRRLLTFDGKRQLHPQTRERSLHLIGTDEVGRGCLAGPVVAAAVILPEIKQNSQLAKSLVELNDSKKLSFQQREKLALILQDISIWAIGEASPSEISELNILHASLLAMRRAIEKLRSQTDLDKMPVLVLVDGNKKITDVEYEQLTVVDGDAKSASIAAASIIAKVHRDRFMMQLSESYPAFKWHQNKGYGSSIHRQALRELGMTEWHRPLFCEKILVEQLTLELETYDDLDSDEQFD